MRQRKGLVTWSHHVDPSQRREQPRECGQRWRPHRLCEAGSAPSVTEV